MFRKFKPQRLMSKTIWFVVMFLIIPTFLIFWFSSNQASLAIQQQAGQALLELNRQNLATMDRVLDSVDQTMVSIMRSELVQSWDDDHNLTLKQRVARYVETEKLLVDSSSQVKYSLFILTDNADEYSFAPSTDISVAGVYFIDKMEGKPWLQKAFKDAGAGSVQIFDKFGYYPKPHSTVAYLRAVADFSQGGETFGILVATEIENVLGREMNSISLPERSRKLLTNPMGEVLSGSLNVASPYNIPENRNELLPNIRINQSNVYIYNDSPSYGNRLIYEIPLDSLVGSYGDIQTIMKITVLCYFLILLIILIYFSNSILRPLARLASLTRSYEPGGKLVGSADLVRNDEIGYVYHSLFSMMERLNLLIKEKYVMELKQKESELILLHSQITPHLLYNTLDSIYWYGIRGGVPEVADMVRDLSTILRIGLSRGKEIITIREELKHVEAYLHLQEKRYNHSFHFHIDVEEGTEECLLPKVVIQPLVENAIVHGIGKMEGEGEVWISIRMSNDYLLIVVEDNGFRPVNLEKIEKLLSGEENPDSGFGIRNVHKRIQLGFGEDFGLSFLARSEGGTSALICLPAFRSLEELPSLTG